MPVDTIREMERTPLSSAESLRVRCPHCRKLYLVQFTDIQEPKPRFECVQCRSRFWLAMGEMDLSQDVIGIPLQVKEVPLKRGEPCPKCFKPVEAGRTDCPSCGVVIEKAKSAHSFIEHLPAHSAHLDTMWKKVIADYGSEPLHAEFLKSCQRERNLAYAGAQYAQMLKLMPNDEITQQKVKAVQALGMVMMPPRSSTPPRVSYFRLWHLPLMGAVLVIIVGMVVPIFRNMVGLGAVLGFLALALKIQFRKS